MSTNFLITARAFTRNEIRVPLLVILPASQRARGIVRETVSLRDCQRRFSTLPGRLALPGPVAGEHLQRTCAPSTFVELDGAISELPKPNSYNPNHGRSPAHRGPLVALAEGDFVYIRNESDGTEEFFNERDDPGESRSLAQVAMSNLFWNVFAGV